jgi:hypothetical protein
MVLSYGGSWAMKTADDARRIGHLVCDVPAVPAVPDDWRCAAGGPFQYFLDRSVDGTEGDENRSIWLEDAVAATNAALSEGAGPRERLDPLDLAVQDHDYVQRTALRNDEVLYRVGIRIVEQGPGRVVLEVLHQSGDEMGSELVYRTQPEQFTYEQLGGGPGWWETRFIVQEYTNDNPLSGPDARAAMDREWRACCERLLVELDSDG